MAGGSAKYWGIWLFCSLMLASWLAWSLWGDGDAGKLMPGPLSAGHHQLEGDCSACHGDGFGGDDAIQQACLRCHEQVRKKPFDSHPRSKFNDPRNADRLEKIDALRCVSCHLEHRPEITLKNGLTQPTDLCFHCHNDIAEERPSHRGMAFDTCTNAGCHNFHNNRALYTDFLIKHLDDQDTKERARVRSREFAELLDEILEYPRDRYPIEPITQPDSDKAISDMSHAAFLATQHGRAGVNCSACHQPIDASGNPGTWNDNPGTAGCMACHDLENQRFQQGKHGMRLTSGLPPMTPAEAHLPMREDAAHKQLTCTACHGAHDFNVVTAAVDACLECHDDRHSLAYSDSVHAALWRQEVNDTKPSGSGVSCATCHMPRIDFDVNDWMSRTLVDHNQSATLSPNSKMIRPVCLHCHGLGFSINALADEDLIERNFVGPPRITVQSMDLARRDHERHLREMEQVSP